MKMEPYATSNKQELRTALENIGLSLPLAFNFHDQKRLWEVRNDKEAMKEEYEKIGEEIIGVVKMNLSINHSNHKDQIYV